MISQSFKRSAVVLGLSAATAFAYADAPAAPAVKWYDTIGLSGYAQTSYVGNLNSPHDGAGAGNTGAKLGNTGRQFDTDSNGFAFNTFLLQIAKPVGDSDHYGFTVRLRTGQDATLLPGGSNLTVQEAYLTYAVPTMTKLQFIGGKFVTSEGMEVVDTVSNPNFSEGLLFVNAEPIAHTGLKANYTINDKVNTTVGIVNGWDGIAPNVAGAPDNNDGKTFLWQVATTPTKMVTWSFQGLYGKELADPSHSQRLSLDTVAGFMPTSKLSLNVQGNWGQETDSPLTAASAGTAHWSGIGLWASFTSTSKDTESARFEVLDDQNNGGRFFTLGGATPVFATTGTSNQTVKEFTLTHKHMMTSSLGMRVEYRHDWSNEAYFVRNDGSSVRNQNTLSADWFLTF
jgi:hypothetical protein